MPSPRTSSKSIQRGRTGAFQHIGGHAGQGWGIVGDQPMTATDQLQGQFAFADPAAAGDQHTQTEHFQQFAVHHGRSVETVPIAVELLQHDSPTSWGIPKRNPLHRPPRKRLGLVKFAAHQNRASRAPATAVQFISNRGASRRRKALSSAPRTCRRAGWIQFSRP
jgi:hypothetical protein